MEPARWGRGLSASISRKNACEWTSATAPRSSPGHCIRVSPLKTHARYRQLSRATMTRQLPAGVSQTTMDHFTSIQWAQPTLDDHKFQIVPMSRTVTHSGHGHTLTGKTWNTDSTIKELLSVYRPSASVTPLIYPQPEDQRGEVRRFYTFGSDLNAHPDLLHGGVIGCILDSTLGGCVSMALQDPMEKVAMFTVQLNITYKKPVRTPGTVLVKAWVTKIIDGGRKVWVYGAVEGDGGVVHATAEGLWLRPNKSNL